VGGGGPFFKELPRIDVTWQKMEWGGGGEKVGVTDVACCITFGLLTYENEKIGGLSIIIIIIIIITLSSQETASVAEHRHLPWLAPSTGRGWTPNV